MRRGAAGGPRASRGNTASARAGAGSLHERILGEIRDQIVSGSWPPGHRIPNETELCAQYGCSRMTVNKVLSLLARGGLIERRRKAGSFVCEPRSQAAVLEIQDIKAEVEALGLSYGYRLLGRRRGRPSASEQASLDVTAAAPVLALDCLHLAGARPFCLERRLINLAAVPTAREQTFAEEAPGPWLVAHVPWSEARHVIRAVAADRDMAAALAIKVGTACLVIERRTWASGQPVTHVTLTYPGSIRELVAVFSPTPP